MSPTLLLALVLTSPPVAPTPLPATCAARIEKLRDRFLTWPSDEELSFRISEHEIRHLRSSETSPKGQSDRAQWLAQFLAEKRQIRETVGAHDVLTSLVAVDPQLPIYSVLTELHLLARDTEVRPGRVLRQPRASLRWSDLQKTAQGCAPLEALLSKPSEHDPSEIESAQRYAERLLAGVAECRCEGFDLDGLEAAWTSMNDLEFMGVSFERAKPVRLRVICDDSPVVENDRTAGDVFEALERGGRAFAANCELWFEPAPAIRNHGQIRLPSELERPLITPILPEGVLWIRAEAMPDELSEARARLLDAQNLARTTPDCSRWILGLSARFADKLTEVSLREIRTSIERATPEGCPDGARNMLWRVSSALLDLQHNHGKPVWGWDTPERATAACSVGYGEACRSLGARYAVGDGVKRSAQRALHLFSRACELRDPTACVQLGELLERSRKPSKAIAAFNEACASRSDEGCTRYSVAIKRTKPSRSELRKANWLLKVTCERGHAPACRELNRAP